MKPLRISDWEQLETTQMKKMNLEYCFDVLDEHGTLSEVAPKDTWINNILFSAYEKYLEEFEDER